MPLMRTFLILCTLCALTAMCRAQSCGREILNYNFNEHTGPFRNWTAAELWSVWPQGIAREDFRGDERFPGLIYTKGLERASVGDQQLRLLMPKDCIGTHQCGARFAVRFEEELEEATLTYRFKFGEEYGKGEVRPGLSMAGDVYGWQDNWTLGGKLPGLADEDAATACGHSQDVTGTGSFVARTMWRQGGRLMTYMYASPTDDECVNGEDWWYSKNVTAEVWYQMSMYIKLNTPEKRDGLHQVWISTEGGEAELVYNRTDVYYRSIQGHGIAKLHFDSFHGGSDSRYSPTTDRYVYFDDLKVRKGLCLDPGLDLFAKEASQNPITQLDNSFSGSYTRGFGASIISNVTSTDPAAKTNDACMHAYGKEHAHTRSSATGSDSGTLAEHPCGDPNAVITPAPQSAAAAIQEASGVAALQRFQWCPPLTVLLAGVVLILLHL